MPTNDPSAQSGPQEGTPLALPLMPDREALAALSFHTASAFVGTMESWGIKADALRQIGGGNFTFVNQPHTAIIFSSSGKYPMKLSRSGIDLLMDAREGRFTPTAEPPVSPTPSVSPTPTSFSAGSFGSGAQFRPEVVPNEAELTPDEVRGVLRQNDDGNGYYIETSDGRVPVVDHAEDYFVLAGGIEGSIGQVVEGRVGETGIVEDIFFER
ncbi:hypothetical protein OAO01_02305 [Oligoflexia bacterium]|nr:hypothetical protein [Oligoflexia bacterium]